MGFFFARNPTFIPTRNKNDVLKFEKFSSMKLPEKGALPMQHIRKLMQEGQILYAKEEHIQPSSLDLSISEEIYRMRGSFLPCKQESIRDIIKEGTLFSTSLEHPLELNGIYLVRLNESLSLNQQIY